MEDSKPKIVKDKKLCTPEYIALLREWIIRNQKEYFVDPDFDAHSWCDFNDFGQNRAMTRRQLCLPGEVFLIDRLWQGQHYYVICTVSAGRRCKDLFPVVKVDDLRRSDWRNGYFLLPLLNTTPNE